MEKIYRRMFRAAKNEKGRLENPLRSCNYNCCILRILQSVAVLQMKAKRKGSGLEPTALTGIKCLK